MKTIIRQVSIDSNKNMCLKEIQSSDVKVPIKAFMSIDGSTSNTGISILRDSDGALCYSMRAYREDGESPVRFKIRLKQFIQDILERNRMIQAVYYEEPCIGHASAVANLFMLRTFIEEMIIENEPNLDYIKHSEINNMKWKSAFLYPDKCPQGTQLQKKAVRDKLLKYLPFLSEVTEDEIDSICMGYAVVINRSKGNTDDLASKKKPRAFQYNIKFVGADEDDTVFQEFYEVYDGPDTLPQNGIVLNEIKGTANFDKKVYEVMGTDDKVVILKFSSNHHGNLILQHRIGHLAATYSYLYAIIWRKTRKR